MKEDNIEEGAYTIKKYVDKWVAISPDEKRILGSGETLDEAASKAKEKGINNPIVVRIPQPVFGYVF